MAPELILIEATILSIKKAVIRAKMKGDTLDAVRGVIGLQTQILDLIARDDELTHEEARHLAGLAVF